MSDSRRIDQILAAQKRPFYLTILSGFFKVFFFLCDVVTFVPHHIFANPEKKLELSEREKARPIIEEDPSSPWRQVDTIDGELMKTMFPNTYTLGGLWDQACKKFNDCDCMGTREVLQVFKEKQADGRMFEKMMLGEYSWRTYADVDETISQVCAGLKRLGMQRGNNIVMFAETRAEWLISAIACFKYGCPLVTVYATLGEDAVAYAIKESKADMVFTSAALAPKVAKAIADCPSIHNVVYFSNPDPAFKDDIQSNYNKDERHYLSFDEMCRASEGNDETVDRAKPDDLAVIMYTSGTTGNPKGVMLSHANIMAALAGQSDVIPVSNADTVIGYLPLAHILEVCAEMVCLGKGCRIGYSSPQTLHNRAPKIAHKSKGDCVVLKPTLMACVPAVMDRIFKAVTEEVNQKSPFFREIFRICYERKRARYEDGYESLLVNKIFTPIRAMLGGELRIVLSGGAPLNAETQRFMNICFCCPVVQGYGLTETCGGGTLADTHDLSTGSVGPPLRCCEILLREWAEAGYSPTNETCQGEILINGGNVAIGYFNNPEKTAEDFININGRRYFATGDIGEFRSDGSLKIIDRKKDLLKLAHGEYISLAKVETALLTHSSIDNICVYGNSDKDHLVALIVPNQKSTEALAEKLGVKTSSWPDVCENKTVVKALLTDLQKFAKGKLQTVEIPKNVYLCHDPWTPASGLLTEALKLKRKNIEKAFEEELKAMYSQSSN